MKVIALKHDWANVFDQRAVTCPQTGVEYTVTDTVERYGLVFYQLQEFGTFPLWDARYFAKIDSSIDETEMERNYQKEKTIS